MMTNITSSMMLNSGIRAIRMAFSTICRPEGLDVEWGCVWETRGKVVCSIFKQQWPFVHGTSDVGVGAGGGGGVACYCNFGKGKKMASLLSQHVQKQRYEFSMVLPWSKGNKCLLVGSVDGDLIPRCHGNFLTRFSNSQSRINGPK